MVNFKFLIIFLFIFFLAGCQTVKQTTDDIIKKENARLTEFIGKSKSELKVALGEPELVNKNESNNSIFTYKSKKYGRRHPFMAISAIPLGVSTYLLFKPFDDLGQFELFLWMTFFSILIRFFLSLFLVPGMSLGAELSSDYEVSKNLNFEIELRYYSKNDNKGKIQGFENLWRYRLALEKEIKLKPIKVIIRLAFQKRTSLDKQNDFKEYLRVRSAFEYSIKNWDWDPYFSVEIIEKTSGDDLQKIRYGIGSSNKVKGSKWTVRYFYQIERFIPKRKYHIFMLKYRYKQKAKSLKKKKSKTKS